MNVISKYLVWGILIGFEVYIAKNVVELLETGKCNSYERLKNATNWLIQNFKVLSKNNNTSLSLE